MILTKVKNLDHHHYINSIALAYAFVLPLSRAGVSFFSMLFVLLWIVEGDFKKKYLLLSQNKVVLALLAFFAFNVFALFWSDDLVSSLDSIKKYWYFLPIFVLFTSIKREYIKNILSAFILGMFLSEVIAYGVFFELWEFKHATPANPSPFMHHIEYSVFLAFTALVLVNRIFNEGNLKYKLFYSFFFITISGNLFLAEGRTGQIAFLLGLFVLAMLSFKHKLKAFVVAMALSTLLVGMAFNFSTTFHDRIIHGKDSLIDVIEKENYCTSWGGRVGAWIISKDIILEDPLLGIGINDNMKEFHHLIDTKYLKMKCMHKSFMHIHNQYLQVLTQLGFVGLFLFLAIFYRLGGLQIRDYEWSHIRYVYLTVVLFAFIPEVLFGRQFSMALFAFIIGLLLAQHRIENEV